MEMHQVRYFVTLCETLNFTKAAETCNVSQPSLTKAILKLEDELGGPLFCRERGLTHLTSLGKVMQPHLQAVYTSSQAARTEANSFLHQGKATLQLGILSSISPTRFISFFQELDQHAPSIALDLQAEPQCKLAERLLAGDIDAAIMSDDQLPDRCDTIPLYQEGYSLMARADHELATKTTLGVEDITGITLLSHDLTFPCLSAIRPQTSTNCNGKADWTQSLVLAGLGCAILPSSTPLLRGIIAIPLSAPSLRRDIALVTVSGRRHTPALRALRSFVTRHDWSLDRNHGGCGA